MLDNLTPIMHLTCKTIVFYYDSPFIGEVPLSSRAYHEDGTQYEEGDEILCPKCGKVHISELGWEGMYDG